MEPPTTAETAIANPKPRRWLRRLLFAFAAFAVFAVVVIAAILVSTRTPADRMFRGKMESEWIAEIEYYNEEQAEEWKEFGQEGVEALLRGLKRAERPRERMYRKWYRMVTLFLIRDFHVPVRWTVVFPEPKMDETAGERHRIISMLSLLDEIGYSAASTMVESLNDEQLSIQQSAIGYYSGNERDRTPLEQLDSKDHEYVFDHLIKSVSNTDPNITLHLCNNAALVLRHYPDRVEESVPVLLAALGRTSTQTCATIVTTLLTLDPTQGGNPQVIDVLIRILNDPDDQIATRAPALLAQATSGRERVVNELLKSMKSDGSLVSTGSARALANFPEYSELIIPALWEAYNDPDQRVRRWGSGPSLKKLDPEGAAAAGIN